MKNSIPIAATLGAILTALIQLFPAPALAQPAQGTKYKDWTGACEKPPASEGQTVKEQCYIYQHITVKGTDKTLLRLAIGYVGKTPKPAAVLTVPLGIFLPPGFAFSIDQGKQVQFPAQFCNPSGCRGILPLTNPLISAMKRGKQAQIQFFDGNRREIGIPISLLGFTAGFDSLPKT